MRVWLVALLLAPATALGQPAPSTDQNKATLLFEQGKAARDAGNTDEACEKFDQSLGLDRQLGTMLNLADCREAQGKLVAAHALFTEAIDLAVKGDKKVRETYARQHADALIGKLARVTLKVDAVVGLEVRIDGVVVPPGELPRQRVVMPGKVTVTATAVGRQPAAIARELAPGSTQTIEIVFPPTSRGEYRAPVSEHHRSKLPYYVGGGGLALVVTSGVLALGAKSSYDDAVAGNAPDTDARIDKAQRRADIATVVGAVGLVAITVGVVLYIRGRHESDVVVAPSVQSGAAGVSIGGAF